jgi:hypothetical protein
LKTELHIDAEIYFMAVEKIKHLKILIFTKEKLNFSGEDNLAIYKNFSTKFYRKLV